MNSKGTVLLSMLVAVFCHVVSLQSQTIYEYSSQPLQSGARAAALADAFIADAYDVNSMYQNPAALTYIRDFSTVINHYQERIINAMNENIVMPFRLKYGEAVAIGFTVNHVGYIRDSYRDNFRLIEYGYEIAYSREIIPNLSVGASVGVRYGRSEINNKWGVASSVGVCYSPSYEISYGMSFNGIGSSIAYLPERGSTNVIIENPPRSLEAGIAMNFPSTPSQTSFALAVANEKIFGQSGIRYKGGIELLLFKVLALRGGYFVEPNFQAAKFGVGVQTKRMRFDYAISPNKLTERSYYISFAFMLWDIKETTRH